MLELTKLKNAPLLCLSLFFDFLYHSEMKIAKYQVKETS